MMHLGIACDLRGWRLFVLGLSLIEILKPDLVWIPNGLIGRLGSEVLTLVIILSIVTRPLLRSAPLPVCHDVVPDLLSYGLMR